jgi:signal transduction histidine kinase/ActR/RegA family two-component response regulator
MIKKFQDMGMIHNVLHEAKTGLWVIELENGAPPRMYADPTMLELLGLEEEPSPEECYNSWNNNIAEEYRAIVEQGVGEIISKGRAEVQYSWIHPKLGRIYVRCGGVPDRSYLDGIRIQGYHQDITDTFILKKEKEELEELNQEIIGSLYDLFFSTYRLDLNTWNVRTVQTAIGLGHLAVDEMPYADFLSFCLDFIHPEDRPFVEQDFSAEHFRFLLQNGTNRFTGEYRALFKGEYRYISCTVYFGRSSHAPCWAILALQDIHEQKRKEAESRRALTDAYEMAQKANNAKSDFLSKMSHDIRTPINAIVGMTTLANLRLGDTDYVKDCLDKISVSSDLLLSLVNEILDMSRIESGHFELSTEPLDIKGLISDVLSVIRPAVAAKKQRLESEYHNVVHPHVLGDKLRLQQILLNILTNANKYTPEDGIIMFSLEELPVSSSQIARFRITIRDTGIGMSQNFLPHLFEPFAREDDSRTSKEGGTGLGMAITKSLLEMMSGTIEVESQPLHGSRFTVTFDLLLQNSGKNKAASASVHEDYPDINSLHLEGHRLLLAEDNELNMEIAKELLELSGAVVETAVNGKEAFQMFLDAPVHYYDIIFMDIQMPVMNGYEAAAAIRRLSRPDAGTIPIIALTANAFIDDIVKAHNAGLNEHISKPIQLEELARVLSTYI